MDELDGTAFKNRILERIKPQKPSPWGLSIGLDHGLINRIFSEGKIPTAKHLLTISRALGVSVDWLLTGAPSPAAKEEPEFKGAEREYAEKLAAIMRSSPEAAAYIKGMIDIKYQEAKPEIDRTKKGA